MFDGEEHSACPFSAEHNALHKPQDDKQDRRKHADFVVAGLQAD
jgi:hypothetical protein